MGIFFLIISENQTQPPSSPSYMYGCGGHHGHVTWTVYINFLSPFPRRRHMKFGFNLPGDCRDRSLKMVVIYMWADNPLGPNVFH